MRLSGAMLLVFACFSYPITMAPQYPHGTVVFSLAVRGGFVMAADGESVVIAESKSGISKQLLVAAEPKIAVCGRVFLCGMDGVNPFPKSLGIEYDFQAWIAKVGGRHLTSPRQFSAAVVAKARVTFKKFDAILKDDAFWHSNLAPKDLVDFQIVGYDGAAPEVCDIRIEVDTVHDRLEYHDPECLKPEWDSPSPTVFYTYPLSLGDSIAEVLKGGTPEAAYVAQIVPATIARARELLPKTNPVLQQIAGDAAAFVLMTDKFNPNDAGGETTVGILEEGKRPVIVAFRE